MSLCFPAHGLAIPCPPRGFPSAFSRRWSGGNPAQPLRSSQILQNPVQFPHGALCSAPNPCVPPCLAVRTRQAIPRHSRSPARAGCPGRVAREASTSWCRASASRSPPAPSTCWSTANSWAPQAPPRSGAAGGTRHGLECRDAALRCLGRCWARLILSGFHLAVFGVQLGGVGGVRVHLAVMLGGCSVVVGAQLCLMGSIREQLGSFGGVTFCYLSPRV